MKFDPADLLAVLPALWLVLGGCALALSEVFLGANPKRAYQPWLAAAFALLSLGTAARLAPESAHAIFGGAATADGFSAFIAVIVAGATALSALSAGGALREAGAERGEFYALVLFAAAGMDFLAMAADLVVLFIALEAMSLALYALAAYRRRARNAEAALKYFVLGSFSSAIFLMGAALCSGAAGSTRLADLANVPAGGSGAGLLLLLGAALLLVGLAFKVAAVPFHMWAPDVYEGSPTPVAGFMAAAVKAASFAALLRALLIAFGHAHGAAGPSMWEPIVATLAGATMLLGNVLALPQRSVKRMLAYSSIAHAGYLLVGVAAAGLGDAPTATGAVLLYLATYAAAVIGAFAVIGLVERGGDGAGADDLDRFSGLAQRHPGLAAAMAAFMLSLAGVPPTAGFIAKLYVFRAAMAAPLTGLAVLGVLTSVAGAYYYLRIIVYMYMRTPDGETAPIARHATAGVAIAAALLIVVAVGVGPESLAKFAIASAALASP